MTDRSFKILADAIYNSYTIKGKGIIILDISNNQLSIESGKELKRILKNENCCMTTLNISNNNLQDKGGFEIVLC